MANALTTGGITTGIVVGGGSAAAWQLGNVAARDRQAALVASRALDTGLVETMVASASGIAPSAEQAAHLTELAAKPVDPAIELLEHPGLLESARPVTATLAALGGAVLLGSIATSFQT